MLAFEKRYGLKLGYRIGIISNTMQRGMEGDPWIAFGMF